MNKGAVVLNTSFSIGDIQMANRHMKRCSTLLIIRKCKSNLTIRYHLTSVRISILKKKKKITNVGEDVEKNKPLYCWCECKLLHQPQRTVWRFFKKLNVELSYNPSIKLLGLYVKKMKVHVLQKIHVLQYRQQHYLQQPRYGIKLSVH